MIKNQPKTDELEKYLYDLSDSILSELVSTLNEYHGVKKTERYWRVQLGHWLNRHLRKLYGEYYQVDNFLFKTYEVETRNNVFHFYTLVKNDCIEFYKSLEDPLWKELVNANSNGVGEVDVEKSNIQIKKNHKGEKTTTQSQWRNNLKKIVRVICKKILIKLVKKNDAVIANTYLPIVVEIFLNVRLKQIPILWEWFEPNLIKVNPTLRNKILLCTPIGSEFELLAKHTLRYTLPTCYLEGYKDLISKYKEIGLPKNPKFIFTSNNYDFNDVFKAWVGDQLDNGTPYYIGQHGNNFGTHILNERWPERRTAEKFITWGWNDWKSSNLCSGFIFKTAGRKINCYKKGGLLITQCHRLMNIGPVDNIGEHDKYRAEILNLYNNLPQVVKKQTTIRLHPEDLKKNSEDEKWLRKYSDVYIDVGLGSIYKLIKKNRIIIHGYDSTGFLETMSCNVPSLCYLEYGLSRINSYALPFYKKLIEVGIIHTESKSLAKFIESIWDDVDMWWNEPNVAYERKRFVCEFAKKCDYPTQYLLSILNNK